MIARSWTVVRPCGVHCGVVFSHRANVADEVDSDMVMNAGRGKKFQELKKEENKYIPCVRGGERLIS